MSQRLISYKQETIISFNKAKDIAHVFTFLLPYPMPMAHSNCLLVWARKSGIDEAIRY